MITVLMLKDIQMVTVVRLTASLNVVQAASYCTFSSYSKLFCCYSYFLFSVNLTVMLEIFVSNPSSELFLKQSSGILRKTFMSQTVEPIDHHWTSSISRKNTEFQSCQSPRV